MIAAFLLHRTSLKRRFAAQKRAQIDEKCDLNNSKTARCRTCLSTDNLRPLFSDSDSEDKMSYNLKLVTDLEIKRDDGLSQKICNKCLSILNLALQFRNESKKAERTLLDMLVDESVNKYTISKDVKPKTKNVKMEENDDACNFQFADDFQNNDDFVNKDVKSDVLNKENYPRWFRASGRRRIILPKGPPYKCNICGKELLLRATYLAHVRFHTNFYVCELCGKRWRNNVILLEHKRAKHGLGKIHKCAHCEYSFARKESLKVHQRRHAGERPFVCDHCGAAFFTRNTLSQHIGVHMPAVIQVHQRRHAGERPFVCDHCGAAFFTRNTLSQHIGVHMPAVIQCPLCPKKCKSTKLLSNHKAKKHSIKYSYQCPLCPKTFTNNSAVHQHLHGVHQVPRGEYTHIEKQPIVWT